MPVRPNILTNATARTEYVNGCIALKAQFTGVTAGSLGLPGTASTPISTWDRFVIWHHAVMNSAHQAPIFLPWHRMMLRTLEQLIATAVGNPNFGLPYWNWAADGATLTQQRASAIWNNDCMGSANSGPGRFTRATFPVRWTVDISGNNLVRANRALRRLRNTDPTFLLPSRDEVEQTLDVVPYDSAPWDFGSPGFRSRHERALHNGPHGWAGGDMMRSTSPNDPVFYLHHCNVDRIWEAWMVANGRQYQPGAGVGGAATDGQRINSPMPSPFGGAPTPAQLLNMTAIYTYDTLAP